MYLLFDHQPFGEDGPMHSTCTTYQKAQKHETGKRGQFGNSIETGDERSAEKEQDIQAKSGA